MTDKPKRTIDRKRDAAVSMTIGSGDGTDEIVAMFPIESRLHFITRKAIHRVELADEIDPERTNAGIPNNQQRVLDIGSDNSIVGRLLLTAHVLFKGDLLEVEFDEQQAINCAWELTKDVAAMSVIQATLEQSQNEAIAAFSETKGDMRSLRLPSVGNPEAQFEAFTQKLGHAIDTLEKITRIFYPTLKQKWIDGLAELAAVKFGADDEFSRYLALVRPTLLFQRDLRNMIEHPRADYHAKIYDFKLLSSGEILVPSIDMVRPGEGQVTNPLVPFMSRCTENISTIAEVLMAHLCSKNLRSFSGFSIGVVEWPPDRRSFTSVRMGYGCGIDGRVVPFG